MQSKSLLLIFNIN